MAVFTPLTQEELQPWFAQFNLGPLTDLQGIASGIENSNFYALTTNNRYIVTIFERLTKEELPFYLSMMQHMAASGVVCASPIANASGAILQSLKGKPAALVTCLKGKATTHPEASHCAAVGQTLAQMHNAASSFKGALPNLRGLQWWQATAPKVSPFLSPDLAALLAREVATQTCFATTLAYQQLPRGAVHADLFRDNVLFDGLQMGGVIDFYFAGVDTFVFDLAVTVNDWCITDETGELNQPRHDALMNAYKAARPLSNNEYDAWPLMLRAAALRFWISRLFDFYLPREAAILTPKDPNHFERILKSRCTQLNT